MGHARSGNNITSILFLFRWEEEQEYCINELKSSVPGDVRDDLKFLKLGNLPKKEKQHGQSDSFLSGRTSVRLSSVFGMVGLRAADL